MIVKNIRDYSGIYIAIEPVDFRKAVDGLAYVVQQDLKMDPFGNYLFLFCNFRRNKLKCITWDKNGFWMGYKRLDGAGAKFIWPRTAAAARSIDERQLRRLLTGVSIDPPRGFGEIHARDF
jgi:transposase